jgi:hypothetical protein
VDNFYFKTFALISVLRLITFYNIMFHGTLLGLPVDGFIENACTMANGPPSLARALARLVCSEDSVTPVLDLLNVFPNSTSIPGQSILPESNVSCVPWPTDAVSNSSVDYLNSFFSGQFLCLEVGQQFMIFSVTPGSWVYRILWDPVSGSGPSEFVTMIVVYLLVAAYMLIAFGIIPTSRLARVSVRTLLVGVLQGSDVRLRNIQRMLDGLDVEDVAAVEGAASILETFLTGDVARATSDLRAMKQTLKFAGLEPVFNDPGPGAAWSRELNLVAKLAEDLDGLSYMAVVFELAQAKAFAIASSTTDTSISAADWKREFDPRLRMLSKGRLWEENTPI